MPRPFDPQSLAAHALSQIRPPMGIGAVVWRYTVLVPFEEVRADETPTVLITDDDLERVSETLCNHFGGVTIRPPLKGWGLRNPADPISIEFNTSVPPRRLRPGNQGIGRVLHPVATGTSGVPRSGGHSRGATGGIPGRLMTPKPSGLGVGCPSAGAGPGLSAAELLGPAIWEIPREPGLILDVPLTSEGEERIRLLDATIARLQRHRAAIAIHSWTRRPSNWLVGEPRLEVRPIDARD
jgi:hypothetical protein